jgi:hypothetical protein
VGGGETMKKKMIVYEVQAYVIQKKRNINRMDEFYMGAKSLRCSKHNPQGGQKAD